MERIRFELVEPPSKRLACDGGNVFAPSRRDGSKCLDKKDRGSTASCTSVLKCGEAHATLRLATFDVRKRFCAPLLIQGRRIRKRFGTPVSRRAEEHATLRLAAFDVRKHFCAPLLIHGRRIRKRVGTPVSRRAEEHARRHGSPLLGGAKEHTRRSCMLLIRHAEESARH